MAELHDVAGHAETGDEQPGPAVDDVLDLRREVVGERGQQVDAEGLGRELPHLGDLLHHLLAAHRRRAHAAEAAGLAHGGHEAVVRHAAHPGQHDGVLDLEDIGQSGSHAPLLGPLDRAVKSDAGRIRTGRRRAGTRWPRPQRRGVTTRARG